MTSRDFCYWLQGYFEVSHVGADHAQPLSQTQVETIQKHLSMVFVHEIDPSMGDSNKQQTLNTIHSGKNKFGTEPVYRC